MRRILKIYDLLKFEDLEKIVTLLPEIKELFEQVDPEYYEFIDNDKKFNFTLDAITKLSLNYFIEINVDYFTISK